jgi:hypothetical protein
MREANQKLTLDRPAVYQIRVPGQPGESWLDWARGMKVTVEGEGDDPPVAVLTGTVADQSALQGLPRRLYSLGLPLLSVICLGYESRDDDPQGGDSRCLLLSNVGRFPLLWLR